MPREEKKAPPPGPPADEIRIDGLRLVSTLGVHPEERVAPRELVAHLRLGVDIEPAAQSDALADAVDWAALCAKLRAVAARRADRLAETLASALADAALEDPRVAWVRLRLDKPGALPGVDALSVVLFRTRR